MPETGLTIIFVPAQTAADDDECHDPDFNPDDYVRLEQEDWEDTRNRESDFGAWLAATGRTVNLYNYQQLLDLFMSQCNADGSFECKIFVKKSSADLQYTVETSHGSLTGPFKNTVPAEEFFRVGPSDSPLKLPWSVASYGSYGWEGQTYDACGRLVVGPALYVNADGHLQWDTPVHGTIHVTATVTEEHFILHAPIRDDAVEGSDNTNYAVVKAIWLGGVFQLEIKPPDLTKGSCSGGYIGGTIINPPPDDDEDPDDDGDDDDATCGKRTITIDACSGNVLSDTVQQIPCPDEGGGE